MDRDRPHEEVIEGEAGGMRQMAAPARLEATDQVRAVALGRQRLPLPEMEMFVPHQYRLSSPTLRKDLQGQVIRLQ